MVNLGCPSLIGPVYSVVGKADADDVAGGCPYDYGRPDQWVYRTEGESGTPVEPVAADHHQRSAEEDEHQIDHDLPTHTEVLTEPERNDQEDHPHHTGLYLAYGGHGEGGSANIWSDWDEPPYGPCGKTLHRQFTRLTQGPVYS